VEEEIFRQYLFFRQWGALKSFCRGKGIELLGDLPIYVDHDSADVWAHQDLFELNEEGYPNFVAGVPPDYFSETGQRWGNPLFRWSEKREELFSWWEARVAHLLCCCDRIRFDHFRGFFAFWSIPGTEPTAVRGSWREGPGEALFLAFRERFGRLPFVAEDLGVITEDVRHGMERLGLPGMRVLLFAFAGFDPDNPYLPHNHDRNAVVYSGTHDNNTALGWFDQEATPEEKKALSDYLGFSFEREAVAEIFLRMALCSVAETAILPMQDLLGLGGEARMNRPGTTSGNWEWRVHGGALSRQMSERLRRFLRLYGRVRK
jgi:4-alpha-glucanotransferase